MGEPINRARGRKGPERASRLLSRVAVRRRQIWAAIAYGAFVIAIVALADTGHLDPMLAFAHEVPFFDKVGHLVLGGLLALLVNLALGARTFLLLGSRFLVGSAVIASIATLEELSQQWFPSRSFDLGDLAADMIGIAIGGTIASVLVARAQQRSFTP